MPTKQWFEENPKVSAYIPKDLHRALEGWMAEKRIKKVSQAITKILEIQLGISDEDSIVKPKTYATVEQLNELRDELKELIRKEEKKNSVAQKPEKTKPQKLIQGSLDVNQANNEEENWLTAKEAHQLYGSSVSYDSFRKYSVEKLRDKFSLEADPNKKKAGGKPGKWLRRI